MHKFTKPQLEALQAVQERLNAPGNRPSVAPVSYLALRRKCWLSFGNVLMVPFFTMVLGIEPDGHTHS